jgi:hypothetical protein
MQWKITRDPAIKARVNRLQRPVSHRLNKWRNTMERCAGILGQCGPVAMEADKEVYASPSSFAFLPCVGRTGGIRFREGRGPGRQP